MTFKQRLFSLFAYKNKTVQLKKEELVKENLAEAEEAQAILLAQASGGTVSDVVSGVKSAEDDIWNQVEVSSTPTGLPPGAVAKPPSWLQSPTPASAPVPTPAPVPVPVSVTVTPAVVAAPAVAAPAPAETGISWGWWAAGGVGVAAAAAGGGGGGGGSNTPVNSVTLRVIDGYVTGATVFYDEDGDGVRGAAEKFGTTDSNGLVTLSGYTPVTGGRFITTGGVDSLTGQALKGSMETLDGASVISPLTSLLASGQITQSQLRARFGIDSSVELTTFDPIAAMKSSDPAQQSKGLAVFAAAQQVMTVLQSAASAVHSSAGGAIGSTEMNPDYPLAILR